MALKNYQGVKIYFWGLKPPKNKLFQFKKTLVFAKFKPKFQVLQP